MIHEREEPFIDKRVSEYLKKFYSVPTLLELGKMKNLSDERLVGLIMGVMSVIDHLDFLIAEQEGD